MFDVTVIGAGVVGGMIARALSAYNLKICLLEKECDVAMGASRSNSAIVHAGYDAHEGSLKALLNVRGCEMMPDVCKQLGVKYKNNGSLVIGFNEDDRKIINKLYQRGLANGIKSLFVIGKDELKRLEPNISDNALCALYAPTGGIVCPYELTLAAVGNAMDNGAELLLNAEVVSVQDNKDHYTLFLADGRQLDTRFAVNAAGLYSDCIARLFGDDSFTVHPRRGEYILLDKEAGNLITHTVFRCPGKMGKGILVSPTVDGNLLTGPTSEDIDDKTDKATTADGLAHVMKEAQENVNGIRFNQSITSFCGLRAVGNTKDFIINSPAPRYINVAGIESPGLSSSPAISVYVCDLLKKIGLTLTPKEGYNPTREAMHAFREMTADEKNEIIKKDPTYGHIICRCETVTEGEIRRAIRTNPKPHDLDGVKRRTRAQMGRCQGGFCSPLVLQILSEELDIPYEDVTKFGGDSKVLVGKTKEAK